jgi:hypothetical protein
LAIIRIVKRRVWRMNALTRSMFALVLTDVLVVGLKGHTVQLCQQISTQENAS